MCIKDKLNNLIESISYREAKEMEYFLDQHDYEWYRDKKRNFVVRDADGEFVVTNMKELRNELGY
jgi:beta-galactosidase beta subunit